MSFSEADLLDANGMRAAHTTLSLLAGINSPCRSSSQGIRKPIELLRLCQRGVDQKPDIGCLTCMWGQALMLVDEASSSVKQMGCTALDLAIEGQPSHII
jgi:hypothetical protein